MRKVFQKFVQIIFKICSQWPALVQVYLVAPLIPGLDWEVATTSDTYQSVSSSRTVVQAYLSPIGLSRV